MKNESIAATLSIVLNVAGILLVHTKVELELLLFVGVVSAGFMFTSFFLILESLEEKDTLNSEFWGLCVVIPLLLPVCLWSIVVLKYFGLLV